MSDSAEGSQEDAEESIEDDFDDDFLLVDDQEVCATGAKADEFTNYDSLFKHQGSVSAVTRLVKDLTTMKKANGQFGVRGNPKNDNLFHWEVELTDFPPDSVLGQDLAAYSKKNKTEPVVSLEMEFPADYPYQPPFVRVIRPRFKFLTGHVTIGGSICMQALTKSGWSPCNDIESILVQVRAEIIEDKEARLDAANPNKEYGRIEAQDAFQRMVNKYNW